MNKMIRILLSVMIVSLSALIVPSEKKGENMETKCVIAQSTTIEKIENQNYEVMDDSSKSEIEIVLEEMNQKILEIESIDDREEWFLAYKDIVIKYEKWFSVPETVFDVYTEEEIIFICRAIETECYDQDFMSKCNVASVILNRIDQGGEFGSSVIEVITKENQFTYSREDITENTILSLMYAYEIEDTTDGCVAFRSDKCPETWYGWKYTFTDDAGHHFYK